MLSVIAVLDRINLGNVEPQQLIKFRVQSKSQASQKREPYIEATFWNVLVLVLVVKYHQQKILFFFFSIYG